MTPSAARRGFTMTELLVVITLSVLLVYALQRTVVSQRRYYAAQEAVSERHETIRIASAILSSALREANLPRGDVDILAPGRVRVRMPLGLAFACGTDGALRVGVVRVEGRWVAGAGDSVLIRRAAGWDARRLVLLGGPVPGVPCVASGGSVLTLDQIVADAVAGSAARAYRSQIFEIAAAGTDYWLYRVDGAQRDLLAGPLDGATGFQAWYEDAAGAVLPGPLGAQRVGMRVIARAYQPVPGSNRRDTLRLTFTGRNR
jgi:prepilin-type N-terminal cleavage/methylation domain-containing protein